jgi:hypothetical protein
MIKILLLILLTKSVHNYYDTFKNATIEKQIITSIVHSDSSRMMFAITSDPFGKYI